MNQENEEPRGFRISDRRRFTHEGETRPAEEDSTAAKDAPASADPGARDATAARRSEAGPRHGTSSVEVSFSTFVLGLSTQALLHLGEIPDPQTGATTRDLTAARQVIDILGVLKQKTLNNLEQAEEALLDSVLHDLRMAFVRLVRAGTTKEDS